MTTKPLRILHVRTVRGSGGGPDKTILKSCEYLTRTGQTAQAFYMLDRRGHTQNLSVAAEKLGVSMHVALENGPLSISSLRTFQRVLTAGKFDIVHTHDYKSTTLAPFFRRKNNFKLVATAHGYNRTTFREALYYRLERWMFNFADAVVVPTRQMGRWLRNKGVSADCLHVIPNGIEVKDQPRPARKNRSGKIRLLYLGRLSPEKDLANLLRALALLKGRGLDVELTLAGDGPQRNSITREIKKLHLSDSVKMPGYVTDVTRVLTEADILVNPSRSECMPNSILEAMATGVPVVATDVGGVGEMIRHGIDGLLCPAKNPQALADAIARLILDPSLADRLAANAHQRVIDEFSFERHMQATLNLYCRVACQHSYAAMS